VARRRELLAEADDLSTLAEVFVLPFAEMATGDAHQKQVVQFLSQIHDDVSFSVADISELIGPTGTGDAYARLVPLVEVPEDLLAERVRVGLNAYLHVAALWARGERREHQVSDEVFRTNLVAMFLGAVTAAA
jgi:hypothetical protein